MSLGRLQMARYFQHGVTTVLLLAFAGSLPALAQTPSGPPRELMLYIRDAKRRGIEEAKIKDQAQTAGWSAAMVEEVLNREARTSSPVEETSRIPSVAVSRSIGDDYLIGAGDSLQVSVWKEPDVSIPSVVVRPDGRITVPLIKEVEVAGLTPRQVEKVITERLAKFLTDPNVTVVLAAINSKRIYVIGAVKKEGTLSYSYGMTVIQALSEAGGLNDYARRKKIYVLRTESGREYRLAFNYEEVVRGEGAEQNIVLQPGDTIVVPH